MPHPHAITLMPLYVNVERIYNEITEIGIGATDALTPEQLFPFDQYHFHGTDAVQMAARLLALSSASRVLEVGSGLGGPSRYLAHTLGCHVTALELQEPVHAIATHLTTRCGLDQRLTHVCGDALQASFPDATFDAVVSWLAVHHIPERSRLLARLARTLRHGGQFYIEDLYKRAPFAATDLHDVHHTIFGRTLTSLDEYTRDLYEAGCTEVAITDLSDDWTTFCDGRVAAWRAHRARHVRVHGEPTYTRLDTFYATVLRLFASRSLGAYAW